MTRQLQLARNLLQLERKRVASSFQSLSVPRDPRFTASYISGRGGLELALRRSVSGVRCGSLGLALGINIDGTIIFWWKVRLRAARSMFMRRWYQQVYQEPLDAPRQCSGHTFALHLLLCDATGSKIWKSLTSSILSRSPASSPPVLLTPTLLGWMSSAIGMSSR